MSFNNLLKAIENDRLVGKISWNTFSGEVFLVGGAIRELLLNKTPNDYDFALTHESDLRVFENIFDSRAFLLGKKPLQTYRIVSQDISLDLTILNGTIEEDLARRDFTINAVAFDIRDRKIVDPLKGIEDISSRIIRFPSRKTLSDDPLRMLKAIRHYATLSGFEMDRKLLDGMQALKHLIHEVAPERIKHELDQIVVSGRVYEGLKVFQEAGLLFEVFPQLLALKKLDEEKKFVLETYGHTIEGFKYLPRYRKEYHLDEKGVRNVAYALLFHDLGKAHTYSYDSEKRVVHFFHHEKLSCDLATFAMEKLRFSSLDTKEVVHLIENHMRIFLISNSESTDKATRRLVYKVGVLIPSLIVLTLCDMFGSSGGIENDSTVMVKRRCDDVLEAFNEWRQKPLPRLVTGHDLLVLGFEQGPLIGKILNDIREKQVVGELSLREEAISFALSQLKSVENHI